MQTEETKSKARQSAIWLLVALGMVLRASAQTGGVSSAPQTPAKPKRVVIVSILDRKLAVLEDGKVLRTFPVAVGADVSPSPTGQFQIVHRLTNPTYYHPGVVIPAGKDNPLGPRWVGLSQKGFGIHGTNQPSSVGKAASHGCIRMRNHDIEQFFSMVNLGDVVEIRGERNQEVARIFGDAEATAVAIAQTQPEPFAAVGGTH